MINAVSPTITLKANAYYVKTVQLEFEGASVEFLEEMNFYHFYLNGMSEECRSLLGRYPFIGRGLRIESMKFIFKTEARMSIDPDAKLPEIADISAGVRWRI